MQNLSTLHEAAEGADFPKVDPNPMGVAGGVAKPKYRDSTGEHDLCLARPIWE